MTEAAQSGLVRLLGKTPKNNEQHPRSLSASEPRTGWFMPFVNRERRRLGIILVILTLTLVSLARGRADALAPEDLLVVFNQPSADSRAAAEYYAGLRKIPKENLVGVEVSALEVVTGGEYDQMAKPIRTAAEHMLAQGRKPAVVLMYGIPLTLRHPNGARPNRGFSNMVEEKIQELNRLNLELSLELEDLVIEPLADRDAELPDEESVNQVLRRAATAVSRARRHLSDSSDVPANAVDRARGLSPANGSQRPVRSLRDVRDQRRGQPVKEPGRDAATGPEAVGFFRHFAG